MAKHKQQEKACSLEARQNNLEEILLSLPNLEYKSNFKEEAIVCTAVQEDSLNYKTSIFYKDETGTFAGFGAYGHRIETLKDASLYTDDGKGLHTSDIISTGYCSNFNLKSMHFYGSKHGDLYIVMEEIAPLSTDDDSAYM